MLTPSAPFTTSFLDSTEYISIRSKLLFASATETSVACEFITSPT